MSEIYYNPNIFTPEAYISEVKEIKPTDKLYSLRTKVNNTFVYENRTNCLNSKWEGTLYFWEDGKLYKCFHRPLWCFKAMTDNKVYIIPGINWHERCCIDKQILINDYLSIYGENWSREYAEKYVNYNDKYGVYSLHVHNSDGRL